MTKLFDDFNRGETIPVSSDTDNWTQTDSGVSNAYMISNVLRCYGGTQSGFIRHDTGGADHYAQVEWTASAASGCTHYVPAVRLTDKANCVAVRWTTDRWYLEDTTTSSLVELDTAIQSEPSAGAVLRLEAEGTDFRFYIDDVLTMEGTTSRNASATTVGIVARAGNNRSWDNWESGLMSDLTPAVAGNKYQMII